VRETLRQQIPLPKEHGAWAMLLGPLAIGFGALWQPDAKIPLLLGACLLLFMARPPLLRALRQSSVGKASQSGQDVFWAVTYSLTAALFGIPLLLYYQRWWLVPLGGLAIALFGLQMYLERRKLHRTVSAELLAVAGMTLTGPAAFYAAQGMLSAGLIGLWLVSFLYWGSSVFYVKSKVRLRARRGQETTPRQRWQLGFDAFIFLGASFIILGAAAVFNITPTLMPLAFLPLAYKTFSGILLTPLDISVRRIGFVELGHSVVFVLLAILVYNSPWG
jgi:hypothetical protein